MVPLVNYPRHVWEVWGRSNSWSSGTWQGNISHLSLGWESKTVFLCRDWCSKKVLLGMQTLPMPARWGAGSLSPRAGCRGDLTPEPRSLLAGFAVSDGSRGHGELEVRAISPLGRQAAADLVRQGARQDSSPALWDDWEPGGTAAQHSGKTGSQRAEQPWSQTAGTLQGSHPGKADSLPAWPPVTASAGLTQFQTVFRFYQINFALCHGTEPWNISPAWKRIHQIDLTMF